MDVQKKGSGTESAIAVRKLNALDHRTVLFEPTIWFTEF